MPKPVSPDRPIWPPLPTEAERQPEGSPAVPEPIPASAEASTPSGGLVGSGTQPDRAVPAASAVPA